MIANIQGEVVVVKKEEIVVQVGGFGVRVFVPVRVSDDIHVGEKVFLHTYLAIRENAWALYGFDRENEREYFELLLDVNGVGPRIALATLSVLTVDAIRRAVVSEQAEVFTVCLGSARSQPSAFCCICRDGLVKLTHWKGMRLRMWMPK